MNTLGRMSHYDTYSSPLASRNASREMLELWSPRHKFNTWRRIWLAVAEAQHEMSGWAGTSGTGDLKPLVTKEQVEELRGVVNRPGGITDEEMKAAEKYERELRHDVMAHVHALGDSCPKAKGIIHLGMTSQDVVCNADLGILSQCLGLLEQKVVRCVDDLAKQADSFKTVPTLAFTHYQPAQPLTVGRRFAQWSQELKLCYDELGHCGGKLLFKRRGLRGATGTQASYLALFEGASDHVDRLEAGMLYELDEKGWELSIWQSDSALSEQRDRHVAHLLKVAERSARGWDGELHDSDPHVMAYRAKAKAFQEMTVDEFRNFEARGWVRERTFPLSTQTYPRVIDTFILADLASTAAVLHKIATDIRLLSNRKEIDEPFEDKQIGSSAMPYKRNPMRCERICGLTRFVMNLVGNAYDTAATQWLERTLDDSSNRRLSLPEAFLALDGALDLMHNVASGLIVHEAMVRKNLMAELPFMATENILMACVKLGGDRQHYHELIRQHSQAAGLRVKQEGLDNDLLERLKGDRNFWSTSRGGPLSAELDWDGVMDPMKYVGRSVEQTERFIKDVVEPLREQYGEAIAKLGESAPKV